MKILPNRPIKICSIEIPWQNNTGGETSYHYLGQLLLEFLL